MKLTVALILLIAATQAAELKSRKQQKADTPKTDKRELDEGNVGIEKRAPVLPTVPPSPGIEYAESKDSESEKSPSQQIYATPVPQIAKISDVLTGQGPPFQAAIASHLYAPVSVYQPRLGAPTTYEVSPPIPSQLAYSEHKISYQPPQNAIQYTQPGQYNQKLQTLKQSNFARPINFQQPYQQQIFVQPQPVVYSQQPQLVPIPQSIFQQIPQVPFQIHRPVPYIQPNTAPSQNLVPQRAYNHGQQTLVRLVAPQPGITYSNEESRETQNNDQASQTEQKPQEEQEEPKGSEQQVPLPQKNYNVQPHGAVSYASFSQSQPAPSFAQQPQIHYQAQPQHQQQYQQPQPLYQQQTLLRSSQPHTQQQTHQPQIQLQYQAQPQVQYQNGPTKLTQETIATASTKTLPVPPARQLSYFRPGPVVAQVQPQLIQPQVYHGRQILIQNPGQAGHASLAVSPSFPPVQYFGKFAQSIFGGYQH